MKLTAVLALALAALAAPAFAAECSKEQAMDLSFAKDPAVEKACGALVGTIESSKPMTDDEAKTYCENKACIGAVKTAVGKVAKCEVQGVPLKEFLVGALDEACKAGGTSVDAPSKNATAPSSGSSSGAGAAVPTVTKDTAGSSAPGKGDAVKTPAPSSSKPKSAAVGSFSTVAAATTALVTATAAWTLA